MSKKSLKKVRPSSFLFARHGSHSQNRRKSQGPPGRLRKDKDKEKESLPTLRPPLPDLTFSDLSPSLRESAPGQVQAGVGVKWKTEDLSPSSPALPSLFRSNSEFAVSSEVRLRSTSTPGVSICHSLFPYDRVTLFFHFPHFSHTFSLAHRQNNNKLLSALKSVTFIISSFPFPIFHSQSESEESPKKRRTSIKFPIKSPRVCLFTLIPSSSFLPPSLYAVEIQILPPFSSYVPSYFSWCVWLPKERSSSFFVVHSRHFFLYRDSH